jgi:hypothetical protein
MTTLRDSPPQRHDLWPALSRFAVGTQPDSLRRTLAAENGWNEAYAGRVIHEYRRFLYIAAVSPFEVTPSKAVDEAWHLHLEDDDSYRTLCARIFGRPFRHLPATGAQGETARHREQYRKTLLVYESVFGTPPQDIWPRPGAAEPPPRQVSAAAHVPWVIGATACLIGGALLTQISPFLAMAALPGFILCAIAAGRRSPSDRKRNRSSSGCGGSCSSGDADGAGCSGSCGGGCGGD